MKVIIAGSRSIKDYDLVCAACAEFEEKHDKITMVVSGGARGVDKLGKKWGEERGLTVKPFPAQWHDKDSPTYDESKHYDPVAGRKRNWAMGMFADGLVLVWDGESTGSADMLRTAKKLGLAIVERNLKPEAECGIMELGASNES